MDIQRDYLESLARLFPQQGEWREENYFALPESNRITELSEGELIVHPTPTFAHQEAVSELASALRTYAKTNDLGKAISAPFDVRLWEDKIRQPDVLFIRTENFPLIVGAYLDGAPDWVAEVISPSSRVIDEVDKLADYAQAGVPEYWLVDLDARTIRVYALADAEYALAGTYGAGETARSETLGGFEIAVDDVIGGPND
jgi:Uma2 family endonuclease